MTDALPEPPAPVQVKVKLLLEFVSGAVLAEPEVARVPLQAPVAVQEVASVDDQLRLAAAPLATLVGLALRLTVGGDEAEPTVTVAEAEALPAAPLQLSE